DGEDLARVPPARRVDLGIVQVREGRRLFPFMTVTENLLLGAHTARARAGREATLAYVYRLFPVLEERAGQLAGSLSGGEQQMCAIGRALMARPKLLMLDEPTLGLAPVLVGRIFETVRTINADGVTVLLVEQNVRQALTLATRAGLFVAHEAREFGEFLEPIERLPPDAGWRVTLVEGPPSDRARAREALTTLRAQKLVNLGGLF